MVVFTVSNRFTLKENHHLPAVVFLLADGIRAFHLRFETSRMKITTPITSRSLNALRGFIIVIAAFWASLNA